MKREIDEWCLQEKKQTMHVHSPKIDQINEQLMMSNDMTFVLLLITIELLTKVWSDKQNECSSGASFFFSSQAKHPFIHGDK